MGSIVFVGLLQIILMLIPYGMLNQPIKRISSTSFLIILFFLLPPLFLGNFYWDTSKPVLEWSDFVNLSLGLTLSTLTLLPMTFKSTVLLARNEIRIFEYNRNIFVFLFIIFAQTLVRIHDAFGMYMKTLKFYL